MTEERRENDGHRNGGGPSEGQASPDFVHEPVMADQVLSVFAPIAAGLVVDATVGAGGHARALLDAHAGIRLLGLDRDADALAAAARNLDEHRSRVALRRTGFEWIAEAVAEVAAELGTGLEVVGVLFDLGVSSPQLDQPERGFSYRHEGPLDMRMDRRGATRAADVVNRYPHRDLAAVLRRFGDERYADRIAAAIVSARPVRTTSELADIVRAAIPAPARRRGGHPARRTFQALRIEVNQELAVLPRALDTAIDLLAPAGRGAVISYHSGEDRIVKERLAHAATGGCTCPPRLPCVCGAVPAVRLLWRGARRPREEEIARNPRAESARLRACEKLAVSA